VPVSVPKGWNSVLSSRSGRQEGQSWIGASASTAAVPRGKGVVDEGKARIFRSLEEAHGPAAQSVSAFPAVPVAILDLNNLLVTR